MENISNMISVHSSFQESRAYLKIKKVKVAVSNYMNGDGVSTAGTLQKRAYWLLNNPKFIFVHYLDSQDAQKRKSQFDIVHLKKCLQSFDALIAKHWNLEFN